MQTILIALTVYLISWIGLILLMKWAYRSDRENVPEYAIIGMLILVWNTVMLVTYILVIPALILYFITKKLLK